MLGEKMCLDYEIWHSAYISEHVIDVSVKAAKHREFNNNVVWQIASLSDKSHLWKKKNVNSVHFEM